MSTVNIEIGGDRIETTEIKARLNAAEYEFLWSNQNLGKNIILLGLGGSHAYGMNVETSDVDLRGVAVNSKRNILTGNDFEQVVDTNTDTVIYSFDKIVKLLCQCNPNTIEILGLRPEHYLYLSPAGRALVDNRRMFLSKRAIYAFGGYANSQLRRMEHKAAREVGQAQIEADILKSIEHASYDYKEKFFYNPNDSIKLYIDEAVNPEYEREIFMDLSLKHYPLRDYRSMWNEMNAIVKAYNKFGGRNAKAVAHDKLSKHMAHLVRLYLMCFDILEYGEIITYRDKDHELLMNIRSGRYLDENKQPTVEFYDMVDQLQARLDYLAKYTDLPDNVNMDEINDFVAYVNGVVCAT